MNPTQTRPATVTHYIASNAHAWGGPLLVWCETAMRTAVDGNAAWDRDEVTCPGCLADMALYLR